MQETGRSNKNIVGIGVFPTPGRGNAPVIFGILWHRVVKVILGIGAPGPGLPLDIERPKVKRIRTATFGHGHDKPVGRIIPERGRCRIGLGRAGRVDNAIPLPPAGWLNDQARWVSLRERDGPCGGRISGGHGIGNRRVDPGAGAGMAVAWTVTDLGGWRDLILENAGKRRHIDGKDDMNGGRA